MSNLGVRIIDTDNVLTLAPSVCIFRVSNKYKMKENELCVCELDRSECRTVVGGNETIGATQEDYGKHSYNLPY